MRCTSSGGGERLRKCCLVHFDLFIISLQNKGAAGVMGLGSQGGHLNFSKYIGRKDLECAHRIKGEETCQPGPASKLTLGSIPRLSGPSLVARNPELCVIWNVRLPPLSFRKQLTGVGQC